LRLGLHFRLGPRCRNRWHFLDYRGSRERLRFNCGHGSVEKVLFYDRTDGFKRVDNHWGLELRFGLRLHDGFGLHDRLGLRDGLENGRLRYNRRN
jgi:hypothetical protein